MKKLIIVSLLAIFGLCKPVLADILPLDSPERKQLIAMGYDIEKGEPSYTFTMVKLGSTRIVFSKNSERLGVSRIFNLEKKLTQSEEFELLKIINIFNDKFPYQFSLSEGSLTASLFIFGSHDPKTFATVVRLMDRVNAVFDTEPKFFKLVNN